jgi:polyisoprenoid-binding protein YceI
MLAACGAPESATTPAGEGAAEAPSAADTGAATEAPAAASEAVDLAAAASGVYTPDPQHRHLLFHYKHQGYSVSYVRWRDWTAELNWNAENPEASTISVTINAEEVDSGVDEFDGHLRDAQFFDVANHPEITFKSASLDRTGDNAGSMTGDLTIKGVTKPVTLNVVLNKAGFDERRGNYKLGFSAQGSLKRSDFGLDAYVPFVDDEVQLIIEAEFVSPKATD